jgi:hypothetical protein
MTFPFIQKTVDNDFLLWLLAKVCFGLGLHSIGESRKEGEYYISEKYHAAKY